MYDVHGLPKVLQHLSFSMQGVKHLFATPVRVTG